MAHDFFKSQEGVEAYKKVGLTYDDEMWDRQYEGYSKLTRKTPAKEVKAVIQNLLRLVLPSGAIPRYEMRINEEMGYKKEKVAAGIDTISSREDIMGNRAYKISFGVKGRRSGKDFPIPV